MLQRYVRGRKTNKVYIEIKCCILLDTLVSGSPILQDDKLIGAITHVFINDSKKGYAIFAENMLETAQSVGDGASASRLKEAT